MECITIAEHFNYCIGNVIKCLWRAGRKVLIPNAKEAELEDCKKARWYLNRHIANLEKELEHECALKYKHMVSNALAQCGHGASHYAGMDAKLAFPEQASPASPNSLEEGTRARHVERIVAGTRNRPDTFRDFMAAKSARKNTRRRDR